MSNTRNDFHSLVASSLRESAVCHERLQGTMHILKSAEHRARSNAVFLFCLVLAKEMLNEC
jgi:hypothetical protein